MATSFDYIFFSLFTSVDCLIQHMINNQGKKLNDKNIQTAFKDLRHRRALQGRAAVRLTDLAVFIKKQQSTWITLKLRNRCRRQINGETKRERDVGRARQSQSKGSDCSLSCPLELWDHSLTSGPLGLCSPQ